MRVRFRGSSVPAQLSPMALQIALCVVIDVEPANEATPRTGACHADV